MTLSPADALALQRARAFNRWHYEVIAREYREMTMVDNPDEARNIGVIAGRDDKGKPLTAEEVAERTKKKLEADAKKSEDVVKQLDKENEEAKKNAEAAKKADEEFLKKQADKAEKGDNDKPAPAKEAPAPAARHR